MFALFSFPWLHIQRTAIQGAATGTNHKLCKLLRVIFIREFGNLQRRRQPAKSELLIRVVWKLKPTHTLLDFTANLGQAFLSRIPHLIANFLITFAILKKLLANFLRNIAIFHSRSKVPHFLSSLPVIPRVLTSGVKVLTYMGLTNSYFFYYNSQRQMNEFCCSGWILLLIYKEYLSPHFVAKFICLADRDGQSNRFILKM